MDCLKVLFSRHAMERMFEREIPVHAALFTVEHGEVIESYPDDTPYPSFLVLGYSDNLALHCVVARDDKTGECIVVTVYIPDRNKWDSGFRRRK